MKKHLLLIFCAISLLGRAQYELWNFQGYSIGANASGPANCAMGAMPDVALINSQYYMYYIAKYNNVNAIFYATSPDMLSWTVQDTIMTASADTANRIYDLGGPGILRLNNGQYRLFYRTAQKSSPPNEPLFHIRSMISADGINFVHEAGVRVENQTYQPGSYFKSASHPAVYKDSFGNTRAILTGRDTSMSINSPAGLYTASSPDEGLTWTNFTPLYAKCHDPVVIKDSSQVFHMYTSYLGTAHREAISYDGISWPQSADSMLITEAGVPLDEQSSAHLIADLGAGVKPNGDIVLFSNYKILGPGAWTDIAYYYEDVTSGLTNYTGNNSLLLFPNPANETLFLKPESESHFSGYEIFSAMGKKILEGEIDSKKATSIAVGNFEEGIYFIRLTGSEKHPFKKSFIIKH